ncbi:MAG: AmmeMemoRadiSam system protein A [Acidobacteriia bacterium]|nr:AmmeMemoRadiSam system protein A [Terriglobia bacterium]
MWQLNKTEQSFLLSLARQSIDRSLSGSPPPSPQDVPPGPLQEPHGAFVTLTQRGRLRGCIGYTLPFKPLYETIMDCAVAAATRDPRFAPLSSRELPDTEIEISVLSPFFEIQNVEEIEVGKHGLMVARGGQQGLLLPQVATEHHFNRERFLEQTCLKAGLQETAWKEPGTRILAFTAFVFSKD